MSRDLTPPYRMCMLCDGYGWIHVDKPGPVIDGRQTYREEVRPCKACNPSAADRLDAPRDDPAIVRHRKHRDRVTGRADD